MTVTDAPGVIDPGRLYTVRECRRRLGLGDKSWKQLRRAGLPVVYRGRRAYVFADDLLALFKKELARPPP